MWDNAARACHLVKGLSLGRTGKTTLLVTLGVLQVSSRMDDCIHHCNTHFQFLLCHFSLLVSSTALLQRGYSVGEDMEVENCINQFLSFGKYVRIFCLPFFSMYIYRSLTFTEKSPWFCRSKPSAMQITCRWVICSWASAGKKCLACLLASALCPFSDGLMMPLLPPLPSLPPSQDTHHLLSNAARSVVCSGTSRAEPDPTRPPGDTLGEVGMSQFPIPLGICARLGSCPSPPLQCAHTSLLSCLTTWKSLCQGVTEDETWPRTLAISAYLQLQGYTSAPSII